RRLRQAGAVICGKTNMSALGTSVTTEPAAFGPTRNPWDLGSSPGGSSGGSAAAVAAGMVAAAHGTDGGGSVRIPAARCGLIGLKPSRGRISAAPDGDQMGGLLVDGVLSRTVRDAALLLDVLAGQEPGDPYAAPPQQRSYADELTAEREPVRVGVYTEVPGRRRALHDDCRAAVLRAAELLTRLGHRVEESAPSILDADVLGGEGPKIYWVAYAAMLARWERALRRELGAGRGVHGRLRAWWALPPVLPIHRVRRGRPRMGRGGVSSKHVA
ncbi:MAG: amidase, partial [Actinobacteria bacterium]|nr:amidase [Actinomycetota bacterium]